MNQLAIFDDGQIKIAPQPNQRERVKSILSNGWLTLEEIAGISRVRFRKTDTPAAISARIRELPCDKRRRGGKGNLWEYKLSD